MLRGSHEAPQLTVQKGWLSWRCALHCCHPVCPWNGSPAPKLCPDTPHSGHMQEHGDPWQDIRVAQMCIPQAGPTLIKLIVAGRGEPSCKEPRSSELSRRLGCHVPNWGA